LIPPVESRPYILLTAAALKAFGIEICFEGDNIIRIPGKQRGKGLETQVEGDCSNAAFLEVLNTFGGCVRIEGLNPETLQGDRFYPELLEALSHGFCEIDLSDCPDLGPVLFAAAAALHGGKFTGTRRLRIKESDRTAAMQAELRKFGIRCENEENSFTVFPGNLKKPAEMLYGHNDHRIVMALASLLTLTGGEVSGAEAVRKSWPEYFETIKELGIEVELYAVDQ
ncbi:MAG: 3-phosphoshikimate 1-carboxyvinyltransferase, partial [Lachnospiraceae bacterium]|nr:3-phosphoshikimate 1-carboxyvinyltransferase [Lachnospiraceae bacterium]